MTGRQDRNCQSPQPVTSVHPQLVILADDLTGACDAAIAFTTVCDPVRVQINSEFPKPSGICATVTESRDLPVTACEARLQNIVERLPSNLELFKKIDSVFRGNTVAEITTTLRHATFDLAILAPAYPALGRTVSNGALHIRDSAADRTIPISALLAKSGCPFMVLPRGLPSESIVAAMRRCLNDPQPAILCDAANHDDLERIVGAARSLGKRVLWIGSGGLAHALAAQLPPMEPKRSLQTRPGHTIFFIGSPHPVTRLQVENLQSTARIVEHSSASTSSHAVDLLVTVNLGETSADEILRAVATHRPAQTGCLFMTGGDTAHFVCRALGIDALRLEREFSPGVPLAIAEGGPFDGVSVMLKSGGFGEPDLLCRLLETCHPEVTA